MFINAKKEGWLDKAERTDAQWIVGVLVAKVK